jgi:hypothetical protein
LHEHFSIIPDHFLHTTYFPDTTSQILNKQNVPAVCTILFIMKHHVLASSQSARYILCLLIHSSTNFLLPQLYWVGRQPIQSLSFPFPPSFNGTWVGLSSTLWSPKYSLHCKFSAYIFLCIFVPPMHAACPAHFIHLNLITLIIFCEEYKL